MSTTQALQAQSFNYDLEASKAVSALRRAFPENTTIVTSKGYQGRVQVKLVSEQLNGRSEKEKQEYLWDVLRRELGPDSQAVSFVLGYGTDEI